MKTLHSSDSSIHYTYTYDLHGNLTQVKDHLHHFTQKRKFDSYDRLEAEEINPGITLHYTYDHLDCITSLTITGYLTLQYIYDAYQLRKIQRLDANGHLLYEIDCSYDLQGNLTDIHTSAGNITYTYDSRAKATAIQSPFWEEHIEEYDAAGNVIKIRQKDPSRSLQGDCDMIHLGLEPVGRCDALLKNQHKSKYRNFG